MKELLILHGTDRSLKVFNDCLIINRKSLFSNDGKETTIYYSKILSIELKLAKGMSTGYIRFILPNSSTNTINNNKLLLEDENAIVFNKSQNDTAEIIKSFVESKILNDEEKATSILNSVPVSELNINSKIKKPIYKRIWFWLVILFIGFLLIPTDKEKDIAKDSNNTSFEEDTTSKTNSSMTQEELNNLYKSDVYDKYQQAMTTYDELVAHWQKVLTAFGNREIDSYTTYSQIDELNKAFKNLKQYLMSIKKPDYLNDEQAKLFNEMYDNFDLAIFTWQESTKKMAKMLDTNQISNSETKKIEDNITSSSSYLMQSMTRKIALDSEFGIEIVTE